MKNKKFLSVFMLCISMAISSCGDDNDNPPSQDFGEVNFTVTGDFEAEKSGFADFDSLSSLSLTSWSIDTNDFSPQTFSLSFGNISATRTVSRPAPGTYVIGQGGNEVDDFSAIYTHIENEDFANAIEYDTLLEENAGTLTIETSNENEVKGSFNFTAFKRDDDFNVTGQIQVNGSFTALKRKENY